MSSPENKTTGTPALTHAYKYGLRAVMDSHECFTTTSNVLHTASLSGSDNFRMAQNKRDIYWTEFSALHDNFRP